MNCTKVPLEINKCYILLQCFFTIKKHEKNKNLYGKERPSADDRAKASDPGLKIVKGRKNLIETSG